MHDPGVSLRQAAVTAGFCLLIMAISAPFADVFVYNRLVDPESVEETALAIVANEGLMLAGICAYLATFICDLLVAWAFYVLLSPVNRSLSLLAAWFRLVYTAIALMAMLKLVTVFRILRSSDYLASVGSDQLHAQVLLLLNSFRYEWNMALVLFGIHLGLLGYLVYRSVYIPRILGIALVIAGSGWLIYCSGPFLFPDADRGVIMITFTGELIFMVWLLVRGWKIEEPTGDVGRQS